MTETTPPNDPAAPQLGGWLRAPLIAVLSVAALAGGIWLIVFFDQLGTAAEAALLRFAGLAIDIALLSLLTFWLHRREHPLAGTLASLLALLVTGLLFAVYDWHLHRERASFWRLETVQTIAVQTATVAVAALGMTVIIISKGIDLSAGTALALCATVLAYCLDAGYGISVALAACILCGVLLGLINGTLISLLGAVPFIVTLGTMSIFLGLGKMLAKETTIRPLRETVPEWLHSMVAPQPKPRWLAYPVLPNFGWGVWLCLVLAGLLAVVLHFAVFGRHVFAVGSNEATARLCGVNVRLTKVFVYTLAGVFVGFAGMFMFARLSNGNPTSGLGKELSIIAAVVIGGGSLSGGRGSVMGTLTGATIMQVIFNGCSALGLGNPVQDVVIGVILVAAAALDQFRNRLAG